MASSNESESNSGPWEGQQPFLTDVFQNAQNLYGQGTPEYYPGQTYANFNPVQEQAMNRTLYRSQNDPTADAMGQWLLGGMRTAQPNMNKAMQAGNAAASGTAGGMGGLQYFQNNRPTLSGSMGFLKGATTPWANKMKLAAENQMGYGSAAANVAGDSSGGQATLQGLAGGGPNPYLDDMYDSASRKLTENYQEVVNPALNATFSRAGRTGSALHAMNAADAGGDYMDSLASLGADIYGGAYEGDASRRLSAGQSLLSDDATRKGLGTSLYLGDRGLSQDMLSQGYGNALDRAGMGIDMWNKGQDRSFNAAQSQVDAGLSGANAMNDMFGTIGNYRTGAASMVPSFNNLQWGNIDRMRGVGDDVYNQSEKILQSDMDRWNYYQQSPYELLKYYSDIVGGTNSINVSDSDSSGWGVSF